MVELGNVGTYNTTGSMMAFGSMLERCRAATRSDVRTTWVSDKFLLERDVKPYSDLPFWLPIASHKGHFAVSSDRAVAAGLSYRPFLETATDTALWDRATGGGAETGLS